MTRDADTSKKELVRFRAETEPARFCIVASEELQAFADVSII
jgi:hypothetical protein